MSVPLLRLLSQFVLPLAEMVKQMLESNVMTETSLIKMDAVLLVLKKLDGLALLLELLLEHLQYVLLFVETELL